MSKIKSIKKSFSEQKTAKIWHLYICQHHKGQTAHLGQFNERLYSLSIIHQFLFDVSVQTEVCQALSCPLAKVNVLGWVL